MILHDSIRYTTPWLNDFGRLFDAALRSAFPDSAHSTDLRVHEDKGGWNFEFDLPGIDRDDLVLECQGQTLEVRIKDEAVRRLPIPPQADSTNVSARFELGVLSIRLPRKEEESPSTKIEIH